jgi:hypothetical protein
MVAWLSAHCAREVVYGPQRARSSSLMLGSNIDPFMLHIYAACAEQERRKIAEGPPPSADLIRGRLSARVARNEPLVAGSKSQNGSN